MSFDPIWIQIRSVRLEIQFVSKLLVATPFASVYVYPLSEDRGSDNLCDDPNARKQQKI
jgi:hypothetical protein